MTILKKLLLINIAAICFVVATFFGLHYVSNELGQSNSKVDYQAIIEKTNNTSDIAWLKKGLLMALDHRQLAHSSMAHSYISFSYLLPAFSIFYLANIFLLIKLRANSSNKSSNLTGAENAPPS